MKKLIFLTVVLFAFTFTSNNLSAQTQEKTDKATVKTEQTQTIQGNFVDKDKNGVCDKHESKMKTGKCTNFVDKNGDGVCDNKGANCTKGGKGNVNCNGNGNGNGNCTGNSNGYKHRNGCGHGNCCGKGTPVK